MHLKCRDKPGTYADSLCYDPPMTCKQMIAITTAINQGIPFSDENKDRIIKSLLATIDWYPNYLDHINGQDPEDVKKRSVAAIAFLSRLSGGLAKRQANYLGRKEKAGANSKNSP